MRKKGLAAVTVALMGILGALAPASGPGGAQAPPSGPVWLTIDSDAGDPVGEGVDVAETPATADFRVNTYDRGPQVVVAGAETWRIGFERPSAVAQLAETTYTVVPRQDRGPTDGGLHLNRQGRGCTETGTYTIDDIAYSGAEVTRLSARFDIACDGGAGLRGEIRWDGSEPLPTNFIPPSPVPPAFPSAPAGAIPADANAMWFTRPLASTPDGQPFSVTGPLDSPSLWPADEDDGIVVEATGYFPVETITLAVKARLQLSTRQPALVPGLYEDLLDSRENPVLGGFELSPGGGGTCTDGSGGADLVVDEVDLGAPGEGFDDLRLRWVVTCADVGVREQGEVRYQRPVPAGAPAAPTGVTAAAGEDTTVVSWTPPASGPTPTGYVVTTYVDGLAVETPTTAGASATSVVVPTPDTGLHTFKVAAVGSAGTGRRSVASAPVAVPGPDLGPFSSIAAFVRQQHRDFAGRQPTTAELQTMGRALARGDVTPQEVIRDLRGRATLTARRAAVSRLYRAAFGRVPDTAGLAYWVQRIATGTSMTKVAESFVASPELKRLYGTLSNTAFVDRVYQNVLGRAADADGRTYWVGQLQQGRSRGRVLLQFADSAEHRTRTATLVEQVTTYVAMVGRVPTTAELRTTRAPGPSATSAQLVRGLLGSTEYAARFA